MRIKYAYLLGILFVTCSSSANNNATGINTGTASDWLIPVGEVFDGGPGKDGIRSIDSPVFSSSESDFNFLLDADLIVAVKVGDEIRGYPHIIMDRHEIVNDEIGSTKLTISYCPLTGSAIAIDRAVVNGAEFGVSGLLYNNNLILYDRETNSNWSQMRLQCVNGPLKDTEVAFIPLIETTFKTFRKMFPAAKVLVPGPWYSYGFPYGDYKVNPTTLFPIMPNGAEDTRLPRKQRVHGIVVGGKGTAFDLRKMDQVSQVQNITVSGQTIVVVSGGANDVVVSFNRKASNGETYNFDIANDGQYDIFPFDMIDRETQSRWNLFGEAVAPDRWQMRTSGSPRRSPLMPTGLPGVSFIKIHNCFKQVTAPDPLRIA